MRISSAVLPWLLAGRSADPVERAIEPLIRVAMVLGVATSLLAVGVGWFTSADRAAYLRYSALGVPLQLFGLVSSLALLQRWGPASAARLFASFVTVTLAAASLQLGAVQVSGAVARLMVPTIVVVMALAPGEAAVWMISFLAAAWLGVALPEFATAATPERLDAIGRLSLATIVLSTSAAILAVFRRALRRVLAESAARAHALARAQRMESLGRLAAGTAHDFNGLLGALFLTTEELREAGSDVERATTLGLMEQILAQARDLTRRLLHLGRGDLTIERAVFDLHDVVDEAVAVVRPTLGARIDFTYERADRPLRVEGSRVELRQAVINLLMNAGDAIASEGRVAIRLGASAERASSEAGAPETTGGPTAWIGVHDSGPGVPDELLERLFEPFVTTKQVGKGTGLGLSTAQAIAHRHHGRVSLDDSELGGAAFVIRIPLVPESGRGSGS